MLKCQ